MTVVNDVVWVVWPTVNLENTRKVAPLWRERGYKVAILVEKPLHQEAVHIPGVDLCLAQLEWKGFPRAVNNLVRAVGGDVVVVAGDDIHPDPTRTAQEIRGIFLGAFPDTFGVMQPTGDQYGSMDLCCQSPWIGRAFINEAYDGRGPYWEEYFHYFSDGELKGYAEKKKAYLHQPDIIQFHDHWQRRGEKRPSYLMNANSNWKRDNVTFVRRRSLGFPNG
jgi:hypothetical protein